MSMTLWYETAPLCSVLASCPQIMHGEQNISKSLNSLDFSGVDRRFKYSKPSLSKTWLVKGHKDFS